MDTLRVSLVTLLMLLAPIALLAQPTSGEDAHQVYMHFPGGVYEVGESVPINATVLNNSEPHDPPEIYLNIEQLDESKRRVDMTRIATGRYFVNLTIQLGDVNEGGVVRFAVVAVFGDMTTETDRAHFYTALYNSLSEW